MPGPLAGIRILDAVFATRSLGEWMSVFDRENVWWAAVQTPDEVVADAQARAAGAIVKGPAPDGESEIIASPADFAATPWEPGAAAPELGQHTEEILLELGYDWEAIARLKDTGAIP